MKKKISCRFLQRAIYYAPDELRHCCKRYFYKGKLMGDVKIHEIKDDESVSLDKIIESKKKIIDKINNKESTDCDGCPVLEYNYWKDLEEEQFDHISVENHARCNMRCSYCSETYYGGKVGNYDLINALNELNEKDKIREDCQVAWGGGEPTMAKDFHELINFVNKKINPKTQRFFSNAINFSEEIALLMKNNIASLTVSVDAGTIDTFKVVRGVNQFKKVMTHLSKYISYSRDNLVIKYIFTELNSTLEEIDNFVNATKEYKLNHGNFLISSNFRDEKLSVEQGLLILHLHNSLLNAGANTSMLDDHVRPRISKITEKIMNADLSEFNLNNQLKSIISLTKEHKKNDNEIVVWGVGEYANLLLDKSYTFKGKKVKYFVDSNRLKQGKTFRNKNVLDPIKLIDDDCKILIASSFWYHDILNLLETFKVDKKRIFPSFLI